MLVQNEHFLVRSELNLKVLLTTTHKNSSCLRPQRYYFDILRNYTIHLKFRSTRVYKKRSEVWHCPCFKTSWVWHEREYQRFLELRFAYPSIQKRSSIQYDKNFCNLHFYSFLCITGIKTLCIFQLYSLIKAEMFSMSIITLI